MSKRLSRVFALTAIAAAVALSGCGKRGTLDRPAPLWGDKAKADYEAQEEADTKAKADKAKADKAKDNAMPQPKATGTRYSPRPPAPESQNTSIRTNPIDGTPQDPRAGPGQATDWTQQPR